MRLDAQSLGVATAIVAGATFALCSLLVAIAPGALSAFLGYALHLDLGTLARPITWASFCVGLLLTSIGTGVLAGAVGAAYRWLERGRVVTDTAAGSLERHA